VDAAAPNGQALARLAAALADGPGALAADAPPVAGLLAAELIACGARHWHRLRARRAAGPASRCSAEPGPSVQALPGLAARRAVQRVGRASRPCGTCGNTAPLAVRGRDCQPDVCVNCYQMPLAVGSLCSRRRECNFAATSQWVCPSCTPKGDRGLRAPRPGPSAAARWLKGPVCGRCYTAALRRRAGAPAAARSGAWSPRPAATTCADCAGLPAICVRSECGIEDKLYE
jgi:hypothetical protein